ncbi:energy transducer TonB [Acinetobacter tianfuensis]|uniref:TonB-dependent receptor n=1 Tax=Acinetobacter tianfuensis TaxID=2419603 RepID=A0A3A8EP53_9GAMM|nr:TonB-dependent receptor [Acinetobacter tianfuensis]RKG31744.1 TonB-dependent receptor [Acinetobacter tianfuensis]
MNPSSAPMMQDPNSKKKKVMAALAAVVIGHVGVLWAVGQMKAPELKSIDKEPMKVRFVKLEEAPKPLPPKPKQEPKKEPPPPKEVKVVDKPLPPPPKKVEKVQQVKKAETPKPAVKPVQTPEKPAPVVSTVVSETKVQAPAPTPVTQPAPVTQPVPSAPKNVSLGGGVSWLRAPKVSFAGGELKSSCSMVVAISANEQGKVIAADAKNSSCGPAVNRKVIAAVKRAQLTKYVENGVAYSTRVEQPFDFQLK